MTTRPRVIREAEALTKAIATELQACEAILDYARFVEDPFERASIRMTTGAQASEVNHLIRHHAAHMLSVPLSTVTALKDQHEALIRRLNEEE